jgi:dimeric dUTPase (all-alpha-NTP-PPase superfamily)
MNLIKSNTALVALSKAGIYVCPKHVFLHFVQSLSLDIDTNRVNLKHIGSSNTLTDQFTEPDVNLNLTFLSTKDFFNEILLGFRFAQGGQGVNSLQDLCDGDYNKYALILFDDNKNIDLINWNFSNLTYVSIGNLYLKNYSISYRVNSLPVTSASFVGNKMKIGKTNKLTDDEGRALGFQFGAWDDTFRAEHVTSISDFKKYTARKADRLVYVMNGISAEVGSSAVGGESNPLDVLYNGVDLPGISLFSFLDGAIKELDISIDFNRKSFYFFNGKSFAFDRKTILPIDGSIKISGTSTNVNEGNLNLFFSINKNFTIRISIFDKNGVVSKIICKNIIVESFSYSIGLNGFLEYSLSCYFNPNNGFLIFNESVTLPSNNNLIVTQDNLPFQSFDGYVFTNDFITVGPECKEKTITLQGNIFNFDFSDPIKFFSDLTGFKYKYSVGDSDEDKELYWTERWPNYKSRSVGLAYNKQYYVDGKPPKRGDPIAYYVLFFECFMEPDEPEFDIYQKAVDIFRGGRFADTSNPDAFIFDGILSSHFAPEGVLLGYGEADGIGGILSSPSTMSAAYPVDDQADYEWVWKEIKMLQ